MISVAARRYAKALTGMVRERALLERSVDELSIFQQLLGTDEALRKALLNPGLTPARRKGLCKGVTEAMAFSSQVMSFLGLLIEKGRLVLLPQIVEALQDIVDEKAGRARAQIITAKPLREETTAEVKKTLESVLGKQVITRVVEDPTLLGGLIVRIGSQVYDLSLKTQLERLRESIVRGE